MFFSYKYEKIRYTGRWGEEKNMITATACGAYFEFSFSGEFASLHFNTENQVIPLPHLWISMDGGARYECPVSPVVKIHNRDGEIHSVTVILKSAVETQHRWYAPLVSKVSLEGITADKLYDLTPDNRKTIEFLGDSITEGVLVDDEYHVYTDDFQNRPFKDDACATYAWRTAENLNLRPYIVGYGGMGVFNVGNASVPKASEVYPYNFYGSPVNYPAPDYILINYGVNDYRYDADVFTKNYLELLKVIRKRCPLTEIFILPCFRGDHFEVLKNFIDEYNRDYNDNLQFIDSSGWVPKDPLHPLREAHKKIAEKLTAELKKLL